MAMHLSIRRIRSVSLAVSLVAFTGLAVVAGAVYLPFHPGPEVEPDLQVETVPGPGSASVAPRPSAVAPQPSGDRRRAAEARADSRVATGAGHDAEFAGLPERAPAAGRIPKTGAVGAGSAEGATETRAEPAGPRAATAQPLTPRERVAVARRVVEPRNSVEPSSRPENMAPIPVRAPRRADAGTTARGARTPFERGAEIKIKRDAKVYITPRNIPKNDRFLKAYSADKVVRSTGTAAPGLLGIATQAYRTQSAAGTANKTYSLADAMRDAVWRKTTAAKLKSLMSTQRACAGGANGTRQSAPSIGFGAFC